MSKSSVNEYGKQIKKRLIDMNQSQIWLVREVKKTTGLYFDGYYLHKIMTGARHPPTIITAINEILNLSPDKQDSA